jgi:hypothetical protein
MFIPVRIIGLCPEFGVTCQSGERSRQGGKKCDQKTMERENDTRRHTQAVTATRLAHSHIAPIQLYSSHTTFCGPADQKRSWILLDFKLNSGIQIC